MKVLLGKNSKYVVNKEKVLQTKDGIIKIEKRRKVVKSHLGIEFSVVEPSLLDYFDKVLKRGPQVILPKDAALILAYTGIKKGAKIVDAGTGSAFLSIFLAWYLRPCKIFSYEKNKKFYKIAKENVRRVGLEKYIIIKNKDILKGIEESNLDMITLDMKNSEKIIPLAYEKLKNGGWLVIYSPYIEGILKCLKEIKKSNFSEVKIVESINREWQSIKGFTRPKTTGIVHTGFLLFARKVK